LEPSDAALLSAEFHKCTYQVGRRLNNEAWHNLEGGPAVPNYAQLKKDLVRLCAHVETRIPPPTEGAARPALPSEQLNKLTAGWNENAIITSENAASLQTWLEKILPLIDESNKAEESRYDLLMSSTRIPKEREKALEILWKRLPVFVLFSNYFRVRPLIHLEHLAYRIENNLLDDDSYDYGNKCLLQLLGFTARELSNLGKATEPQRGNADALKQYQDQLVQCNS